MNNRMKPRTSRRRSEGRRVLKYVASFNTHGDGAIGVTIARAYAREHHLKAPAVIHVRRNSYTVDSFFLSEKGMFGLPYVEFNWMLFPCLRQVVADIGEHQLFGDMNWHDWSSEEESYRPEYAFI